MLSGLGLGLHFSLLHVSVTNPGLVLLGGLPRLRPVVVLAPSLLAAFAVIFWLAT